MYVLRGSHDLNIRSAFLHVMGDTLSSFAVIAAAVWIAFTGQTIVDPLLSIGISLLVVLSSFSLLREAIPDPAPVRPPRCEHRRCDPGDGVGARC